ncbi:MAG: hydrogen peroxide-inducible genes activator [Rhodospirillaceae bacterium]|jgi:LysR family transcriptional regulator, hydrogen peroxide-inducible genes activator|nr:hydrogen peroxide-inducible genes activator [Rhodospirillaceae bacterium]MBT4590153.1 hydrogen peroxide-inducible genes activator [Rhodospirillaceae bacterium]MBT4939935.1 hydrogen peroxide-inducible genes activator [Rhodospirillaceae bacterium]MBT5940546.1 hydrogen peroxide-inducible genes activator [Rhodospirillaceae bacterium]MBT7269153.1 hydrogen peroxide-inducible genes activator [Rhodospirillaceae bacterium]
MKLLPSLKQLEYLVSLAGTQHFGHASDRCSVTPSTLSAGIRDLEAVLGVTVAERTKRTVLMTSIGIEIAGRAQRLLRDAEDIMEFAAAHREPLAGEMKLGVIPTIGPFLLPKILPDLNVSYPDLRLYLREEMTAVLLTQLRAGDIDLALIALPFDTEDLTTRILFEDEFRFACNSGHPLADQREIAVSDLSDKPLLLLEEGHCLRGHALDACQIHETYIRTQFEATSLHTLVQMVSAGLGVTLLPRIAIEADILAGTKIKLVSLADKASRQIGLVWRSSSPRINEFELLANIFSAR